MIVLQLRTLLYYVFILIKISNFQHTNLNYQLKLNYRHRTCDAKRIRYETFLGFLINKPSYEALLIVLV